MINGVVALANELLGLAENVNRVGFEVDIDAELTIASHTGFLSHHLVNGIHKINRATKALSFSIRQLRLRECVRHSAKRRSYRQPCVIVCLLRYKLASCSLVVMADVVVDQTLLLRQHFEYNFPIS